MVLTPYRRVSWDPSVEAVRYAIAELFGRGNLSPPLPSPTMPEFLTVKDASRLTGKSASSIRRIIYPIIRNDVHADRLHVEPTVEEVSKLRTKGENFAWRLSKDLLYRELPPVFAAEQAEDQAPPFSPPRADMELLAMLRRELEIKNQQIAQQAELFAKQMELINGLGERLREGNILIGSLQQRLSLTDGRPAATTKSPKPKRATSTQPAKGGSIASKPAKPKKSFLSRIFG